MKGLKTLAALVGGLSAMAAPLLFLAALGETRDVWYAMEVGQDALGLAALCAVAWAVFDMALSLRGLAGGAAPDDAAGGGRGGRIAAAASARAAQEAAAERARETLRRNRRAREGDAGESP